MKCPYKYLFTFKKIVEGMPDAVITVAENSEAGARMRVEAILMAHTKSHNFSLLFVSCVEIIDDFNYEYDIQNGTLITYPFMEKICELGDE